MTAHTPGPWSVDCWTGTLQGDTAHQGTHEAVWKDELLICPTGLTSDPEALPNARLIAAAPELLEALQIAVAETLDYIRLNHLTGAQNNHWIVLARQAIAKATGVNQP